MTHETHPPKNIRKPAHKQTAQHEIHPAAPVDPEHLPLKVRKAVVSEINTRSHSELLGHDIDMRNPEDAKTAARWTKENEQKLAREVAADPAKREALVREYAGIVEPRVAFEHRVYVPSQNRFMVEKVAIPAVQPHHPVVKLDGTVEYPAKPGAMLSSTVGSEAWNSRDLKSRPH